MRILFAAALAAFAALPAMADETEGHVMAFDRKAGIIVLTDLTVWAVPGDITVPADLGRGDRVLVEFQSEGEDGLTKIDALTRLAVAMPEGTDGGS